MNSHSREVARNAAVVGGATLLSRILGFLRDVVVAFALGAGLGSDAFFVAFRVPNLLRRLFGEGSLTMAFIPVFSRIRTDEGDEAAFALARSVQVWLMCILGALVAAGVLLAPWLTRIIAPGFTDDKVLFGLTVHLIQICFPYILFISSVALCMGILNAMGHFLMPALAPCVLNIVLIVSALAGYWGGGNVAVAMSWGVLAGGILQWLFQQRALRSRGFSWRGPWGWKQQGVQRVGKLMLPTVFGAAVYQINIVLSTLLASFLPMGSVSYLYYADRLVQFPLGVFGIAVGTAALPSLSRLAADKAMDDFRQTLDSALGLTIFIALPSTAGLIALAVPIIQLLFERGAFAANAAASTSAALVAYGIGLPAIALVRPLVSAFYALEDTRTPVLIAFVCMLVNVGLGYVLMQSMAHVGLALAVSVSGWLNALLLLALLHRRAGKFMGHSLKTIAVSVALSLCIGVGAWQTTHWGMIWALALIPVWGVAYLAFGYLLRMGEARSLVGAVRRKLGHARGAA
ncbi:MAG: murein biosynthesis integral membrane protein MurJ [Desulfovibrio sp.]|uniref:murein biosynthesis integral membrane protein MurJ n=1 Tax=Desulfovibrio sp. 7SRBS1 TaxID=3378064 RepID=UPI003B3C8DFD